MEVRREIDYEAVRDEICDEICKWRVRAFEQNKDPDDAEKWLDMNYCGRCPVSSLS